MKCCLLAVYLRRLPLLILLGYLPACKTKSGNQLTPNDLLNPDAAKNKGLALLTSDDVVTRKPVHAVRLDDIEFRVNAVRVGEETFLRFATPIVSFELPKEADYTDILRCPANVIIYGGAEDIDNVELGAKNAATETKIFQRNNFWETAAATSGCVIVANSYTDATFEDTTAPSGKFNYYLRACVDQNRLIATENFSTANCSRQITRSAEIQHSNKRGKAELEALTQAAALRNQIDTIGRQIVDKTMLLNEQLYQCQQHQNQRVLDFERKNAISNILNTTIGVGIPALGALTVGLLKKRALTQPTLEGAKTGLRKDLNFYDETLKKYNNLAEKTASSSSPKVEIGKTNPQLSSLEAQLKQQSKALTGRINTQLTTLDGEVTRLSNELFKGDTTQISGFSQASLAEKISLLKPESLTADGQALTTSRQSIAEQMTKYLNERSQLSTIKLDALVPEAGSGKFDASKIETYTILQKASNTSLSTTTKIMHQLSFSGLSYGAASLIASVYNAGAQAIPGYPKDAESCYNNKSEQQIARQIADSHSSSKEDLALICSCATALATPSDLKTLATDLQQRVELYQAQREASEDAARSSTTPTQPTSNQ